MNIALMNLYNFIAVVFLSQTASANVYVDSIPGLDENTQNNSLYMLHLPKDKLGGKRRRPFGLMQRHRIKQRQQSVSNLFRVTY